MSTWVRSVVYRLRQGRQLLGFVHPLSCEDEQEVRRWLPASALPLFATMSNADKQHSLRVCRGLQTQGCVEHDMLAAALLHDVGKAQGRVPFWTRPAIVLGKRLTPRVLARLVVAPPFMETHVLQFSSDKVITDAHKGLPYYIRIARSARKYSRVAPCGRPIVSLPTWRRSLSYAWFHADVGADLAANVGLSERTVLYIRTHHDPHGPAAALHRVDEVS